VEFTAVFMPRMNVTGSVRVKPFNQNKGLHITTMKGSATDIYGIT